MPDIVAVTGTKGKTTVVRLLASVLHKARQNVLRVDTDGHFINEIQKSDQAFSIEYFGDVIPTVCPGKYLLDMRKYYPNFVSIFEEAFSNRSLIGLGYGKHKVGVFTNIYEDHLGVWKKLNTRKDLAETKNFIFQRIGRDGYAVFNADDKYVCSQLSVIKPEKNITLIPCGITFKYFNIKEHVNKGGSYITSRDGVVLQVDRKKTVELLDTKNIPWMFNGKYLPSIWNVMFACGSLLGLFDGEVARARKYINLLGEVVFPVSGGRLVRLKNNNNVEIIVDFAHEKYSLREVAKLIKSIAVTKRTTGVIRVAPDRPNNVISDLGKDVANRFDNIIVYDKIDGVKRREYISRTGKFDRKPGEVSNILYKSIFENKKHGIVERLVLEEEAIKRAAELSCPGEGVVIICNDDHKGSIGLVKKYFKAKIL